jgi:hypothetical protein
MNIFLMNGKQDRNSEDLDLGNWIRLAEERCLRVGNLRRRLEIEREWVIRRMEDMAIQRGCGVKYVSRNGPGVLQRDGQNEVGLDTHSLAIQQGGGEQSVSGRRRDVLQRDGLHSQYHAVSGQVTDLYNWWKVATDWAEDVMIRRKTIPVRKGTTDYCLTSYTAWWRRIEKEERNFDKEVRKNNLERRKKDEEKEERRKVKEAFVRKFFPASCNSPGGTLKIISNNSASGTGVGKMKYGENSAPAPVGNKCFMKGKVLKILNFNKYHQPSIKHFEGTVPVANCDEMMDTSIPGGYELEF